MFKLNKNTQESFKENRLVFFDSVGTDGIPESLRRPEEPGEDLTILRAETEGLEVRTALQRRVMAENLTRSEEDRVPTADIRNSLRSSLFDAETINDADLEGFRMSAREKFTLFNIAQNYLVRGNNIWNRLNVSINDHGVAVISGKSLLDLFANETALRTVGFKVDYTGGGNVKWTLIDKANLGPRQREWGTFTEFWENELRPNMSDGNLQNNFSARGWLNRESMGSRTVEADLYQDIQGWMDSTVILANTEGLPDISDFLSQNPELTLQMEDRVVEAILDKTSYVRDNVRTHSSYNRVEGFKAEILNQLGHPELVGSIAYSTDTEIIFTSPDNKIRVVTYSVTEDGSYDMALESMLELNLDDPRADQYLAKLPQIGEASEIPIQDLVSRSLVEGVLIPLENQDGNIFTIENGLLAGASFVYNASIIAERVEQNLRNHPEYFRNAPSERDIKDIAYYIAGVVVTKVYQEKGPSNFEARFSANFANLGDNGQIEIEYYTDYEIQELEEADTREFLSSVLNPEIDVILKNNGDPIVFSGNIDEYQHAIQRALSNNKVRSEIFQDTENQAIIETRDYIMSLIIPQLNELTPGTRTYPEFIINSENPTGTVLLNTPDQLTERGLELVQRDLTLVINDPENTDENFGFIEYTSDREDMHDIIQDRVEELVDANDGVWTTNNVDPILEQALIDKITIDIMTHLAANSPQEGELFTLEYFLENKNSDPRMTIDIFSNDEGDLLSAMQENIAPFAIANDAISSGFFTWNFETPQLLKETILEEISRPERARTIIEDYRSLSQNEPLLLARLEQVADYIVAQITTKLENMYPNGFENQEFSFHFYRNAENPAGTVEVTEPEDITLASAREDLRDTFELGVTVSGFRNTVTGRDSVRNLIQQELLNNSARYFEDHIDANLNLKAGLIADEWTQQLAAAIERTARDYEYEIDLAVKVENGTPSFQVENAEEIFENMQEIRRTDAIETRYREIRDNRGFLQRLIGWFRPGIDRDDVAAEMAANEVSNENNTLFLLGLLIFPNKYRNNLRSIETILERPLDQIGPRTPRTRETAEPVENITEGLVARDMDRQQMRHILADTQPSSDEMRDNLNDQAYRFDNFRLAENTEIKLIDAQIQVQDPRSLDNVQFEDELGNIIHVTRPNTPPYIVDFRNREVYIRAKQNDGRDNIISMDIVGKLSYYNAEAATEPTAPVSTPEQEPELVS